MPSRFLKQLIYGALYLLIFAGIGYGVIFLSAREATCFDERKNQGEEQVDCGGPCASCEAFNLRSIEVLSTSLFSVSDTQMILLVEFKNSNVSYGAEQFFYDVRFYNREGMHERSVTQASFLYPGEIKFIVEAFDVSSDIVRAEIMPRAPVWIPSDRFVRPRVSLRNLQYEVRTASHEVVVTGIAANEDTAALSQVVIAVVVHDSLGTRLSASKTFLSRLGARDEASFRIVIPMVFVETITREALIFSIEAKRE